MKTCKQCKVEKPFTEFSKVHKGKYYKSYCKKCSTRVANKWKKNNSQRKKSNDEIFRKKLGTGIYIVKLFDVPLYVGEGNINARKHHHLFTKSDKCDSQVKQYCDKHNINRKLLSFNILEYEDDKQRMVKKETYYRTVLTPIINPTTK